MFDISFCSNKNDLVRVLDAIKRDLKNELQNLVDDIEPIFAKDIQNVFKKY